MSSPQKIYIFFQQLALMAVAPSIAAGGTVFATTSKRKGEHDQIWLASKGNFVKLVHI